jgi:hypothetical protein
MRFWTTISPKQATLGLTILGLLLMPSSSFSGIYRWTDAEGKVHFSDQPPEERITSEEVSDQLSPLNRDSSTQETHKLQRIFQQETSEEKALQQQEKNQQQLRNQKTKKACQKATQKLHTLMGPVYFVDKKGNEIIVSEEERVKRAQRLEQEIRRHCS